MQSVELQSAPVSQAAPSPAGRWWQQEGTLVLKLCLLADPFPLGEGGRDEGDPRNML